MSNAISYSIFGADEQYENCFSMRSYLRGLHLNIRMAELLYPGWKVCVATDNPTVESPYKNYFLDLHRDEKIDLAVFDKQELCIMMLYRLAPLYMNTRLEDETKVPKYTRVLCRDTDSLLSYRERQAVAYWESTTKMAHAITDSISHTIDLMGGMIGFVSGAFRDRVGPRVFSDLLTLARSTGIDFNRKGSDQDFLNRMVLPKVADSITEHYVLGKPQSFRGDCFNFIQDIDVGPEYLRETNGYAFHIGASGFQTDAVVKFLKQYGKNNEYWDSVERQFPEVFYWHL